MASQFVKASIVLCLVALLGTASGCRSGGSSYDPRFQQVSHDFVEAQAQPAYSQIAANPVVSELAGPHPVETYIEVGLLQNSEIHEARLRVESLANRVPQAASLSDPMLGATAFPSPVQTAAGEQEFALSLSQKVPGRGKLATRAAMAEEDVNIARANLAEIELKVVEQIKNTYFQLYFVQQAIEIIQEDREQLQLIGNVVERMYEVKREVTQQDVIQVQVALSQIDTELAQFRQQKKSAQAKLARLLHISPETNLETADSLPPEATLDNIDQLYEIAIQCRPELHAQLATIQRNRQAVCLAELESQPDMNLGFNWIATSSDGISPVANGDDAFMLTLGMNLPVYRKRIDAGVREAETRTMAEARKYDRLKDETMESVTDLFAKSKSIQETLRLFRDDILPKQQRTLDQSIEEYQVGKVDFLQMMDNWRKLLRFHIQEKRFESDLQQVLASLARQLGSFELSQDVTIPVQPALENGSENQ